MTRQDGGYGWIIVAAFFFAEIIIDGVRLCFGVMFVDLLQEFQAGKGETALTGSIVTGAMNLLGRSRNVCLQTCPFRWTTYGKKDIYMGNQGI